MTGLVQLDLNQSFHVPGTTLFLIQFKVNIVEFRSSRPKPSKFYAAKSGRK